MFKKTLLLASVGLITVMSLSACDGGSSSVSEPREWKAIEYVSGVYDEERTAGKGIKWVLVAMAPKKGPVLEPIMTETKMIQKIEPAVKVSTPPPLFMPEPEIRNATPIFVERTRK